jgi:hypothetical protein
MHAYEGHVYGMASVRNTPMRNTPIYIGWRKGVAFVAAGGRVLNKPRRFRQDQALAWSRCRLSCLVLTKTDQDKGPRS